jgi:hypothetical protein
MLHTRPGAGLASGRSAGVDRHRVDWPQDGTPERSRHRPGIADARREGWGPLSGRARFSVKGRAKCDKILEIGCAKDDT